MKLTNAFIKIYYKSNHLTTLNLKIVLNKSIIYYIVNLHIDYTMLTLINYSFTLK